MFDKIKTWLWVIGSAVIAVLFGLLKYEHSRRIQTERELEDQVQANDLIVTKEVFEATNREKAKQAERITDEKLDDGFTGDIVI